MGLTSFEARRRKRREHEAEMLRQNAPQPPVEQPAATAPAAVATAPRSAPAAPCAACEAANAKLASDLEASSKLCDESGTKLAAALADLTTANEKIESLTKQNEGLKKTNAKLRDDIAALKKGKGEKPAEDSAPASGEDKPASGA